MTFDKGRARLKQQHVGGLQTNLPEATRHPAPATTDRQHGGAIERAKMAVADLLPDELALVRDHRFHQAALAELLLQMGFPQTRRPQTTHLLQLHGALRGAGKDQVIPALEAFARPHHADHVATAFDFHQEETGKMAQPSLLNGAVDQRPLRIHFHLDGELAQVGEGLLTAGAPGQQTRRHYQQVSDPNERHGHAHPGDLEQSQVEFRKALLHQGIHHQIGAGTHQGDSAAED